MAYIPHTEDERQAMLAAIGVEKIEDLYTAVPEEYRFPDLDLPDPISEMEAVQELQELAEANLETRHFACFLGAGAYNHFIPSVVDHILRRSEFLTAYTPYQPEISQGTLQAIFEYQSLVSNLTGMDVSNASHYDGATALAEAVIMALAHHRQPRSKIVLSAAIHPQYRQVVRTYMQGMGTVIVGDDDLGAGPKELAAMIDEDTLIVAVQYPDFLGRIEEFAAVGKAAEAAGAVLRGRESAGAGNAQAAIGIRRGCGGRRWTAPRHSTVIRWALPGNLHHPQEVRAQDGRTPVWRDDGRAWAARLRAHSHAA